MAARVTNWASSATVTFIITLPVRSLLGSGGAGAVSDRPGQSASPRGARGAGHAENVADPTGVTRVAIIGGNAASVVRRITDLTPFAPIGNWLAGHEAGHANRFDLATNLDDPRLGGLHRAFLALATEHDGSVRRVRIALSSRAGGGVTHARTRDRGGRRVVITGETTNAGLEGVAWCAGVRVRHGQEV